MNRVAILSLMFASIALTASADWPRFRGPNGIGISDATTIPTEWTDDDYNWITDLPGEGHGSPVAVGDRIFALCGDMFTAERRVTCVSASTGDILWTKRFKSAPHYLHRDNNYASSTPAADADGVVAIWTTPSSFLVIALDNDGNETWRKDYGEYKASWGGAPSPIIVDDFVVLMNDQMNPKVQRAFLPEDTPEEYINKPGKSFAVALSRSTGEEIWKIERRSVVAGYSTPCVRDLPNGKKEVIFLGTGNGMTAVDLETGEVNWQIDVLRTRICMAALLAGDLVVGSGGNGLVGDSLVAVRPPANQGDKPELVFNIKKSIPLVPTALHKDGLLYLAQDTGVLSCVSAETGAEVWRKRTRGKFYASPICVGDRVFCVNRRGDVLVLKAGDKFEQLAKNPLGEDSYATPGHRQRDHGFPDCFAAAVHWRLVSTCSSNASLHCRGYQGPAAFLRTLPLLPHEPIMAEIVCRFRSGRES